MNDFTKEELEIIIDAFHHIKEDPAWRNIEGWDDELKTKIQSMINNYCEHECKHEFERKIMQIDLCEKCKNFKFVMAGSDDDNQ